MLVIIAFYTLSAVLFLVAAILITAYAVAGARRNGILGFFIPQAIAITMLGGLGISYLYWDVQVIAWTTQGYSANWQFEQMKTALAKVG